MIWLKIESVLLLYYHNRIIVLHFVLEIKMLILWLSAFVSPQHGRTGPRSAWGGQIGGTGVDLHGSAGISLDPTLVKGLSCASLSSSENSINSTLQYR